MHTITINSPSKRYEVLIGNGLLDELGNRCRQAGLQGKCVVISDSTVAPLYAQRVLATLAAAGYQAQCLQVPAGEASKSMQQAASLCSQLTTAGIDRKGFIIALGGGVVGDLAGFVASIHYRGIPFVQVPTTIVSQVDSSVGGKTGVNLPEGKNLTGSFYQPSLVLIDPLVLQSLQRRVLLEGFAEIIKHAVIADEPMLDDLLQLSAKLQQGLDSQTAAELAGLIARNVQIKASIVEQDPHELSGLRALLNFGHTVGHAIEASVSYGELLHGECVALGMRAALELSVEYSALSEQQQARVLEVIKAYELGFALPSHIDLATVLQRMGTDKKFESGQMRFVLTKALGSAYLEEQVKLESVRRSILNLGHSL